MEKKFKQYLEEARNPNKSKLEAYMEAISAMRKLKKFKDMKSYEAEVESEFKGITKKIVDMEDTVREITYDLAALLQSGRMMGEDMQEDEDEYETSLNQAMKLMSGLESISEFDLNKVKKYVLTQIEKNNSKYHDDEADKASAEAKGNK